MVSTTLSLVAPLGYPPPEPASGALPEWLSIVPSRHPRGEEELVAIATVPTRGHQQGVNIISTKDIVVTLEPEWLRMDNTSHDTPCNYPLFL